MKVNIKPMTLRLQRLIYKETGVWITPEQHDVLMRSSPSIRMIERGELPPNTEKLPWSIKER